MSWIPPPDVPESCNASLRASHYPSHLFPLVYVFGDVHGDYTALVKCLSISRLVARDASERLRWCGAPGTALVVLGDAVDRFRACGAFKCVNVGGKAGSAGERPGEEMQVLMLLDRLAAQAAAARGAVFRLFGNHEFMNLDYRDAATYTSPLALDYTEGVDVLEARGWERADNFRHGRFHHYVGACVPHAILQIGNTVFCHGGLDPRLYDVPEVRDELAATGQTLLELANRLAWEKWESPDLGGARGALFNAVLWNGGTRSLPAAQRDALHGRLPVMGVLWDDQLAAPTLAVTKGDACAAHLGALLRAVNADHARVHGAAVEAVAHFAVAHCTQSLKSPLWNPDIAPSDYGLELATLAEEDDEREVYSGPFARPSNVTFGQGINAECDGAVWRVDVGMSRAFLHSREYVRSRYPHGTSFEVWYAAYEQMRSASRPQVLRIHFTPRKSQRGRFDVTEAVTDQATFSVIKYKGVPGRDGGRFLGLAEDEVEAFS